MRISFSSRRDVSWVRVKEVNNFQRSVGTPRDRKIYTRNVPTERWLPFFIRSTYKLFLRNIRTIASCET